jgi:hypothetical protein
LPYPDFVGSHLQLKNTLVQAKADMDAAAKAAQAEARAKTKTPPQKETNGTTASKPSEQPVKPAEPVQPPRPKTASLFDMPAEPPREAVVQPETEDEDDILAEIKDDGAEEEGLRAIFRANRSSRTYGWRCWSHLH